MQDNPSHQPDRIGLNAKGLMACGQRMEALPSNAQRCGNLRRLEDTDRTLKFADRCRDRITLRRPLPGDHPDSAVSEAMAAASAGQPAFALALTACNDYVDILKFLGRQILKFPKHFGVVITDQPIPELVFA